MSRTFGPSELLECYRRGVFPMGESQADTRLFLVDPDIRGVLPLRGFHIPRRLARFVRSNPFVIRFDTAFSRVVELCAEPAPGRTNTWINTPILNLYSALHRQGHAHSVECWLGDELVGGLYGVSLKAAFFGESMFSRRTDASKVALAHLVARLIAGGYQLLDAQFVNDHLKQFGIEEISRDTFQARLMQALAADADFGRDTYGVDGAVAVQLITQTS